jgi:hypothetical protein
MRPLDAETAFELCRPFSCRYAVACLDLAEQKFLDVVDSKARIGGAAHQIVVLGSMIVV